jgi:hypothetical protein
VVARRAANTEGAAARRGRGSHAAPTASQPPVSSSPPSPAQNFDASVDAVLTGANPVPWHHVGRQQLADLMGVHPDSVTDFTKQGMPVIVKGGHGKESVYDAVECLAWWRKRQGRDSKEVAQARAANASAEINELKIQKERGELIPFDQVLLAGQAVQKQWSTVVRGLPRRMTQAGLIERAQEAGIAALCTDVLREITAWRPELPR